MDDQANAADAADKAVAADEVKLAADQEAARLAHEAEAAKAAAPVPAPVAPVVVASANNALGKADMAAMQQAAADVHNALNQQAKQVASPADVIQPTVDEMAAKQRDENLQRAIANGYREPAEASPKDRVLAVIASMEHQIQHNGPITLEMIRDLRDALGLPAPAAPASEG